QPQGNEGAGNGSCASAAVGLDDVTINPDGALAELVEFGDGSKGTSDEPLNFVSAPALPPSIHLSWRAGQRGAWQHAVLAGYPSFAGIAQERWHGFFNGGRADDAGITDFNQY